MRNSGPFHSTASYGPPDGGLSCTQMPKAFLDRRDTHHIHHIGLRLASSCDTRCNATPFYMFTSATIYHLSNDTSRSPQQRYEPYVKKFKNGNFTLLRADIYLSPEQQYDYYRRQTTNRLWWTHRQRFGTPCVYQTPWSVRSPVNVTQDPPQIWRRRQWTSTPSKSPQQHRNVHNDPPSKYT